MPALAFENVAKSFTMHLQGGTHLPVISGVNFRVDAGECVVLAGPSGTGKSTVLKLAYGNYRAEEGRILLSDGNDVLDMANAAPREILAARRSLIGYVSQFLSVIPRVPALDLVVAEARDGGHTEPKAVAEDLLSRLNLPSRLWALPPATFSGGERQRVNIAIALAGRHKVFLIDEPTAALDAKNREVVIALIREKLRAGAAVLAIFHDEDAREALATRFVDIRDFAADRDRAA